MLSGIALIAILPLTTTIDEQGIYYALLGLVSLYVVADLGLSTALINFISHQIDPNDQSTIDRVKTANLARLVSFAKKWAIYGSILLGIFVYIFGTIVLDNYFLEYPLLHSALLLICVATIFTFQLFIGFAILEGLNNVTEAFFLRTIYVITLISIQVIMLASGLSYFSLAIGQITALAVASIIFLLRNYPYLKQIGKASTNATDLSIRKKVIPFQLRVAVSWLFGFLPIQLMPTLLIGSLGAAWAGRIGMTQQLVTAISATAFIFVQTVVPKLGQLVASGHNCEIKKIYKIAVRRSFAITMLGIITIVIAKILMEYVSPEIADRILPLQLLIVFITLGLINWITFARAALARTYHQEIMFWPTILGGVSTLLVFAMSSYLSPTAVVYGLVISSTVASIIIGGAIFRKFIVNQGLSE